MRFHLLFEQSGTFKNVFKEHGHEAFDYDILNDFNETDYQIDLFHEIEVEYENIVGGGRKQTIFSKMERGKDFIIAFFPCTYFSGMNEIIFKGFVGRERKKLTQETAKSIMARNHERAEYFNLYIKLGCIAETKGLALIIENPALQSFLEYYSPIPLGYHEGDRQRWGDVFKKPTNFFTVNFNMEEKFQMFTPTHSNKTILNCRGMKDRSMISKTYAENFYKRFLEDL